MIGREELEIKYSTNKAITNQLNEIKLKSKASGKIKLININNYQEEDSDSKLILDTTPLHKAVFENDLEKVRTLVNNGVSLYQIDKNGDSALALAIKLKHTEVAKIIIEKELAFYTNRINAEVLALINLGNTALCEGNAEAIKHYNAGLILAEEKGDLIGILYCIIKLGDYNLYNNKYDIAAMNYSSARVFVERHNELRPIFPNLTFRYKQLSLETGFIRQICKNPIAIPKINYESYTEKLSNLRREIEEYLQQNDISEKHILKHNTSSTITILASMISDCINLLGTPPCDYAILGLGSMGREEMGPFSDIEYAIAVEINTQETHKYFYQLIDLLELKVIALGETAFSFPFKKTPISITKRGFGLDGGGTPKGRSELFGTVRELSLWHNTKKFEEDLLPSNMLKTVILIHGSEILLNQYEKETQRILSSIEKEGWLGSKKHYVREGQALSLMEGDIRQFGPRLGTEKTEKYFNIKMELYRLAINLIAYLALYYGIEGKNSWDRLDQLLKLGIINAKAYTNLNKLINFATRMRVKTHLFYGQEEENIYHKLLIKESLEKLEINNIYEINDEELKQLEECYKVLIPINKALEQFVTSKGKKDFRNNDLYEDSLYVQAYVAEKKLDYKRAEELYKKALDINPEDIDSLQNLIRLQKQLGLINASDKLAKKSLRLVQAKFGLNHPKAIVFLNIMGEVYFEQGKYLKANEQYQQALKISKEAYGEKHSEVANILKNIGDIYFVQANYDDAIKSYYKSSEIIDKLSSKKSLQSAVLLNCIGEVLTKQAQYKKAEMFFLKSIKICKEIYIKDHPEIANSLHHLGNIYEQQGNLLKAHDYYRQALDINEKLYGYEHPKVSILLLQIGSILEEFGFDNTTQILERYTLALEVNTSIYGGEHPKVADSIGNLATAYYNHGDYNNAYAHYSLALNMIEKLYGDNHPLYIQLIINRALVLSSLGEYESAYTTTIAALNKVMQDYSSNYPLIARSYNVLGHILKDQDKYKEAEEYYLKAFSIYQKTYSKSHPKIAGSMLFLGEIYEIQFNLDKAKEYYLKSLDIFEKIYGKTHSKVIRLNIIVAKIYYLKQEYFESKTKYNTNLKRFNSNLAFLNANSEGALAEIYIQFALFLLLHAQTIPIQVNNRLFRIMYSKELNESIALLEAKKWFIKALDLNRKIYGEKHPKIAEVLNHLGKISYNQDNFNEAEALYLQAIAILNNSAINNTFGENPSIVKYFTNLGDVFTKQNKYLDAKESYAKALNVLGKSFRQENIKVAELYAKYGELFNAQNDFSQAVKYYQYSISILDKLFGETYQITGLYLFALAMIYYKQNKYQKALEPLNKALSILDKKVATLNIVYTECTNLLNQINYIIDFENNKETEQMLIKLAGIQTAQLNSKYEFSEDKNNLTFYINFASKDELKLFIKFYNTQFPNLLIANSIAYQEGSLTELLFEVKAFSLQVCPAFRSYINSQLNNLKNNAPRSKSDLITEMYKLSFLFHNIGLFHYTLKEYSQAILDYTCALKMLDIEPNKQSRQYIAVTTTFLKRIKECYIELANNYFLEENIEQAKANYDVIRFEYTDIKAHINEALLSYKAGNIERSIQHFKIITILKVKDSIPLNDINNLNNSLVIIKDLLGKMHPDYIKSLKVIAKILKDKGELNQGEKYLQQAQIIRNKQVESNKIVYKTGANVDDIINQIKDIIDIENKGFEYANALYKSGAYLIENGKLKEAFDILKKALVIFDKEHPYYTNTLYNIGYILNSQRRFEEALGYFFEAYEVGRKVPNEVNPNYKILYNIGQILIYLGRYQEAYQYCIMSANEILNNSTNSKYLSDIPLISNWLLEVGNLFYNREELEMTINLYELSSKLFPQAKNINHNLACWYHVKALSLKYKGEVEQYLIYINKASLLFEEVLYSKPNEPINSNFYTEYAMFLVKHHKVDNQEEYIKIVELLKNAIELQADNSGLSYNQLDKQTAVELIQKLLEEEYKIISITPYILAYYLLIKIHLVHSNIEKAKEVLKEFNTINLSTPTDSNNITHVLYNCALEELKEEILNNKGYQNFYKRLNINDVFQCITHLSWIIAPLSQSLRSKAIRQDQISFEINKDDDYFSYLPMELITYIISFLPEAKVIHLSTIEEIFSYRLVSRVEIKSLLQTPEQINYTERLRYEQKEHCNHLLG
ncbi:tetratricopeptide repeat protein [Holosporaceae bacterium 'Namur']|nr:tetratricopeptide repeat protein [Holosporaceae bacterium 'Namur']